MSRAIEQNTDRQRFQWIEGSALSVLDYRLEGDVLSLTHTEVPPALAGRGIAADLTKFALDMARTNGWRVQPLCSYTVAYLRRHPEYQDLVI
ncbi:MAG: N-acetyltransferase [Burkholderiaceae bacterium]|nr:N-acetyltransferase [Burkholderiaceae bacterium]